MPKNTNYGNYSHSDSAKRAAAYIRVSTDDQLELSPDSQLKEIRAYADRNGYTIADEYIFHDDGISGTSAKRRPAFMEMIATAKKKPKPFDAIIVWKFSRFARSREDSIVFKSMLKKLGISVISVSEPITDDKMSIIVEGLIESMDEYYSANLSEEVKRGMLEKFSRKQAMSAAPYGYRLENKKYVPEPAEAEIIKEVFTRFVNGETVWGISKDLKARGIKTKRGNITEPRTIHYYLDNPVYIGSIRYTLDGGGSRQRYLDGNYMIQEDCHEPIISKDLWNEAQKLIKKNREIYGKSTKPVSYHEYALKGIVKCASCEHNLTYCSSKDAPRVQCPLYVHNKCDSSSSVRLDRLNEALLMHLQEALKDKNLNIDISADASAKSSREIQLEAEIKRETSRLARMKEAYLNGADTIEEYKENKSAQTKIISRLEKELKKLSSPPSDKEKQEKIKQVKTKIKTAIDALQSTAISETEKNALLKTFISKALYDSKTKTLTVYYYAK